MRIGLFSFDVYVIGLIIIGFAILILFFVFLPPNWQKLGFNEKYFVVDLKKGEVKEG